MLLLGTRSPEPKRLAFRLARELKVWAALRHPHVLPLLGFYLGGDYKTAVLISEYMEYGDLKDYIIKMAPTYNQRLHLVRDLTDGLTYLHTRTAPIRHGDLKPGNVLVNRKHRALLADFGLSKALDAGPTGNDARGTVRYQCPEILLQGAEAESLANDMWSWACLVLEAMIDKIPFAEFQPELQLIVALIHGRIPCGPENLNAHLPQFNDLLMKCWSRQPSQRPSAADCLCIIQSALPPLEPQPQTGAQPLATGQGPIYVAQPQPFVTGQIPVVVAQPRGQLLVFEQHPGQPVVIGPQPTIPMVGVPAPGQPIAVQRPGEPFIISAPQPGQPLVVPTGQPIMIPLQPGQTGQPPIMIQRPGGGAPIALHPGQQYIIGQPGMPFVQLLQPSQTGVQPIHTGVQPISTGVQPIYTGVQPIHTGVQPIYTGVQPIHTGVGPIYIGVQPIHTGLQPHPTGVEVPFTGTPDVITPFVPQVTGGTGIETHYTGAPTAVPVIPSHEQVSSERPHRPESTLRQTAHSTSSSTDTPDYPDHLPSPGQSS